MFSQINVSTPSVDIYLTAYSKRDCGSGPQVRSALGGRHLRTAPGPAPARQEQHHLLLADVQEPRLYRLQ